jgi:hypothetical protein
MCEKCGRVYLVSDDGAGNARYESAPESGECFCGVRLFPEHEGEPKSFSARAVCEWCAERETKAS